MPPLLMDKGLYTYTKLFENPEESNAMAAHSHPSVGVANECCGIACKGLALLLLLDGHSTHFQCHATYQKGINNFVPIAIAKVCELKFLNISSYSSYQFHAVFPVLLQLISISGYLQ